MRRMFSVADQEAPFMRIGSEEEVSEYWVSVRSDLTQDYKRKRKDAVRRQNKLAAKRTRHRWQQFLFENTVTRSSVYPVTSCSTWTFNLKCMQILTWKVESSIEVFAKHLNSIYWQNKLYWVIGINLSSKYQETVKQVHLQCTCRSQEHSNW